MPALFLGLSFDVRKLLGLKKRFVGLDLKDDSVTLVKLRPSKEGFEIEAFAKIDLPENIVRNGNILMPEILSEAIQKAVSQTQTKGYECTFGLSGYDVIVKKIFLPRMSMQELEASIHWEAEQYLPFDINDVHVDFQILNPDEELDQMEVMLIATKKTILAQLTPIITAAGLKPVVADVSSAALSNIVLNSYPACSDVDPVVCVDIQTNLIHLTVLHKGRMIFHRDSSVGSKNGSTEVLFGEITRAIIDFFAATSCDNEFARFFLTANSLRHVSVDELSNRFRTSVEVIDPLKNMRIDTQNMAQADRVKSEVIALGLARRSVDEPRSVGGSLAINLYREKRQPPHESLNRWSHDLDNAYLRIAQSRTMRVLLFVCFLALVFGSVVAGTIVGNLLSR